MRVTSRNRLRDLRAEERGAVVAMVAILLVVMLGMLMLVVDLGGMVARKRVMVRAADSAALSAAQECVRFGVTGAEAAADGLAAANAGVTVTGGLTPETANCQQGYVEVRYDVGMDLYFAPIIGIDQTNVVANAIASWSNPPTLPVTLNLEFDGQYYSCPIAPTPENCDTFPFFYVIFDNDQLTTGRWGFLKHDSGTDIPNRWYDEGRTVVCGGSVSTTTLGVPAWACADTGLGDWQRWLRDEFSVGERYVLPLNDGSVGPPDRAFHITGFALVELVEIDTNVRQGDACGQLTVGGGEEAMAPGGNGNGNGGGSGGGNASDACVKLEWVSGGVGVQRPIRLVE